MAYVKNPVRGHTVEKHHPEGGKRTTYSPIQRENGNGTKILGISDISKETKKDADNGNEIKQTSK